MGKRSSKENKNIYFETRESIEWSRAQASEALEFISESRLEKIENEKTPPRPEEILAMARAYNKPMLCNHYCSHDCPIGQEYVPEIQVRNLAQIILEMISSLNSVNKEKDRLIDIAADGMISDDELVDFAKIQNQLNKISLTVDTLQLWINSMTAEGVIDKERFEKIRDSINE